MTKPRGPPGSARIASQHGGVKRNDSGFSAEASAYHADDDGPHRRCGTRATFRCSDAPKKDRQIALGSARSLRPLATRSPLSRSRNSDTAAPPPSPSLARPTVAGLGQGQGRVLAGFWQQEPPCTSSGH